MSETAQKHAIDVQLLSIKCGAVYGALAFAGLIVVGIAMREFSVSILAIVGAFFAYLNYTLLATGARGSAINAAMAASIVAGIAAFALAVL